MHCLRCRALRLHTFGALILFLPSLHYGGELMLTTSAPITSGGASHSSCIPHLPTSVSTSPPSQRDAIVTFAAIAAAPRVEQHRLDVGRARCRCALGHGVYDLFLTEFDDAMPDSGDEDDEWTLTNPIETCVAHPACAIPDNVIDALLG
ncbi:hypothetical protein SDRG_00910 [Saprolegnia diclina VS20]|uniref:Uncharacterized protein n=1 Tax=Saprolegnia diclina (strain VS20) TaxID=1156394 RepID=T0S9V2_SAPDV|nr:hypothetical protein SDRG_00910 [Saprolegnia diclina VS20]EQC42068.1 hypothetical protein SDRG_00910 [Saprolegnia diclina VS20]|eukprot:XP_008604637.1 hypothetical protein SDRG_00910 [Saprolegnia diclina VS20]